MTEQQRLVLYIRVSTEEQALSGLGLEAQKAALEKAAEYHSWSVVDLLADEGVTGKTLERPGLYRALQLIAAGEADGIAVSKLDRLTRSVIDFGLLLEWLEDASGRLIALDLNIDTSSPGGRMVATVLVAVAQWERDMIAARTRDGLAVKRARGEAIGPPAVDPDLADRILHMRRELGMTYQKIADTFNAEGIPTARGGKLWRPSSIQTSAGLKRRSPRRKYGLLPDPKGRSR